MEAFKLLRKRLEITTYLDSATEQFMLRIKKVYAFGYTAHYQSRILYPLLIILKFAFSNELIKQSNISKDTSYAIDSFSSREHHFFKIALEYSLVEVHLFSLIQELG